MGSFTNGALIGLGVSLLLAPMKGKEMRQMLAERARCLRGIPPANPEIEQSVTQMSDRVHEAEEQATQMRAAAQNFAQQAATSANAIQGNLGNAGQQTTTNQSTRQKPS